MRFLSLAFSVALHILVIILIYLLITHTKKEIAQFKPPVYHVDIIQLPKNEQNEQKRSPYVVASNINRKSQSKIYSKSEKVPISSKPKIAKQKVPTPKPPKPINQTKSQNSAMVQEPSKQSPKTASAKQKTLLSKMPYPYKISGDLLSSGNKNMPNINSQQNIQGSSNIKEYESPNVNKQATIEIGTESIKYVSYMKLLKDKIQNVWVYPQQARINNQQGTLLVLFGINKNGSLAYVKVIHSSSYPILDEAAIKAIKDASPFNPLPERFGVDRLNIYATFTYQLVYHYVQ